MANCSNRRRNASRLNVLEQLQSEHEGLQRGHPGGVEECGGRCSVSLADKIRVPDQYIAAIETALGHHLQLVITEQPEGGASASLADLSANKKGRALPLRHCRLAARRTRPRSHSAGPHPTGIERGGSRGVRAATFTESARRDVDCSRSLMRPRARGREGRGAFDFVTLSGEILSRHGVYTGGVQLLAQAKAPASISWPEETRLRNCRRISGQAQEQVNELRPAQGSVC